MNLLYLNQNNYNANQGKGLPLVLKFDKLDPFLATMEKHAVFFYKNFLQKKRKKKMVLKYDPRPRFLPISTS